MGNWFKEKNIFGRDEGDFLERVEKENIGPRGEDGGVGQRGFWVTLDFNNVVQKIILIDK